MGDPMLLYHQNLQIGATHLRTAPAFIPFLRHLCIHGDHVVEDFAGELGLFVSSLHMLETISVTPYALSDQLFTGLSSLLHFRSLDVLECGKNDDVYPDKSPTFLISHPIPELREGAFPAVQGMSLTSWSPIIVRQFIIQPYFPTFRIRRLWIRFATNEWGSSPVLVNQLLAALAMTCFSLEDLTLRFASYGWEGNTQQPLDILKFADIEPFLDIALLHSFSIDYSWALLLTQENLHRIAERGSRFRVLLLNPYPTFIPDNDVADTLPALEALHKFAEYCPLLETLGVLLSAMHPTGTLPSVPFRSLRHLFIGWSRIPIFSYSPALLTQWQSISDLLSRIIARDTKLITVYGFDGEYKEDRSLLASAPMRARGQSVQDQDIHHQRMAVAWSSVWAMALFDRKFRMGL